MLKENILAQMYVQECTSGANMELAQLSIHAESKGKCPDA